MQKVLLLSFTLVLLFSCAKEKEKEKTFNIGQQSTTIVDESRDRPIVIEIWYPTYDSLITKETKSTRKELFKNIKTIPNASMPEGKFPLLLVSHGTGGNRFSLTWFIEDMVKKGYIVVSVDHYGNSTFNKLPREFVKWWERAIDIKYTLTTILEDTEIGPKIDRSKIGGVGFSLGGYTNIALAGGYVDREVKDSDEPDTDREMPPEFPQTDEIIDFDTDSLIVASYNTHKDHVKDDRIKAFFVMAPAIGFGFHSKKQTETITAPVYIVAGKGDTNTPVKHNAIHYHNLIPTSKIHLFGEHVDHYIFLNEATEFGKKVAPEITIDHPEVNRKEIHQQTMQLALDFFEKNL
ncbi:alpha/beta hydrolase family protein [Aquimarina algiphila]|uniref:Dienelactone hydrolase n=1 Tax=Aquimarina algiphila TaxID=2047982 RepID=A0A554VET5_9FLAO|nr:dienelactone hydrolase [Aquimarina algiphila]TSE05575.1 dienelactone hydrolase [Aquimarina algiphila]